MGLQGTAVDTAFKLIGRGEHDASARQVIEALRENFDSEYLQLQYEAKPNTDPEVLCRFGKARAAAAFDVRHVSRP
jgi:hypothetical protein